MAREQLEKPAKAPHFPSVYHEYSSQSTKQQKTPLPAQGRKISMSIVVMSVPVLYVFLLHLSPHTLLKDTKFWFLVSNTIIIVIAADSGLFSAFADSGEGSSSEMYDEFVKRTRQVRQQQQEHLHPAGMNYELQKTDHVREPVRTFTAGCDAPYLPEDGRIVSQTNGTNRFQYDPRVSSTEEKQPPPRELLVLPAPKQWQRPVDEINGVSTKKHRRCKTSEVPLVWRNRIHGKEVVVSRSDTFPVARKIHHESNDAALVRAVGDGNDEYSTLSDEELNRRVEEFIKKVNRQIRLQ